jgi:hypothetical protein
MKVREVARATALRAAALAVAAALFGLAATGCGGEDFENRPRPPRPVDLTAKVDSEKVNIAPSEVGAGLTTITISNQSDDPIRFTLDGPTQVASQEIPPGGVGDLKVDLDEGLYEVSAGEGLTIRSDILTVGPERPSSQNELLLP